MYFRAMAMKERVKSFIRFTKYITLEMRGTSKIHLSIVTQFNRVRHIQFSNYQHPKRFCVTLNA